MLSVRNLDKFAASLDAWLEDTGDTVAHVANGLTVELFNEILPTSPQFSGDFAGNWQYSINTVNTTFNPLNLLDQPKQAAFKAGDHPAIAYSKAMNKGRDASYKLGDTFYLANSAYHDEAYAVMIENEEINFRRWAGNRGATVDEAFRKVLPKYTNITKQQAYKLARKKL